MSSLHIADAEAGFMCLNITPDFCNVNGTVVPFEISRELPPEEADYAQRVRARGEKVLHLDSVVSGVNGNMGSGVSSGVSLGGGNVGILQGAPNVRVEGKLCTRHQDLCDMNVG